MKQCIMMEFIYRKVRQEYCKTTLSSIWAALNCAARCISSHELVGNEQMAEKLVNLYNVIIHGLDTCFTLLLWVTVISVK